MLLMIVLIVLVLDNVLVPVLRSGGLQGPFPEHWMRSWVQAGHLLPDHEVSSCATGPLVTIRQLFPDVSRAFLPSTAFDLKQARHCVDLLLRSLAQNPSPANGVTQSVSPTAADGYANDADSGL